MIRINSEIESFGSSSIGIYTGLDTTVKMKAIIEHKTIWMLSMTIKIPDQPQILMKQSMSTEIQIDSQSMLHK